MPENRENKDNLGRLDPQLLKSVEGFRVGQAHRSQPAHHRAGAEGLELGPSHHAPASKAQDLDRAAASSQIRPIPVFKMASARGVEYGMMSITLWVTAVSLAWVLLNLANGHRSFDSLVLPTANLSVSLPIYVVLFFRLKSAEQSEPRLKLDPSRRRWSQLSQFLAFLVSLTDLIVLVYAILIRFGTIKSNLPSLGKTTADAAIVLLISVSLLAYYWVDEHRLVGSH